MFAEETYDNRVQSASSFRVIWENEHIFVVEKPAGMVTHPAYRHPDGTLTDAVAAWMADRGQPRPWLLHRLDRDTSGIVLFARTERARKICVRQFEDHQVVKHYIALVWGDDLPERGMIDAAVMRDPADRRRVVVASEGQAAQTCFQVRERWSNFALMSLWPLTGRTHQLRAHLAYLGHPIAGDPVYAAHLPLLRGVTRLLLHATALTLRIPVGDHTRQRTFLAPLPPDFILALNSAIR
jgi:23S rRNA pseudouridine1911/1915/1917 synthase